MLLLMASNPEADIAAMVVDVFACTLHHALLVKEKGWRNLRSIGCLEPFFWCIIVALYVSNFFAISRERIRWFIPLTWTMLVVRLHQ